MYNELLASMAASQVAALQLERLTVQGVGVVWLPLTSNPPTQRSYLQVATSAFSLEKCNGSQQADHDGTWNSLLLLKWLLVDFGGEGYKRLRTPCIELRRVLVNSISEEHLVLLVSVAADKRCRWPIH